MDIMQPRQLRFIFGWLALAAVFCFAAAQTAALSPGHSDNHATHCCQSCHVGHSLIAQHTGSFLFDWQPTRVATRAGATDVMLHSEFSALAISTRAPPASLV
jgi:hypothetical protein